MYETKRIVVWVLAGLLALVVLSAVPLYVDWIWFLSLGYGRIFSTILLSKIALGVVVGALFFAVVWGNAWYALRSSSGRLELYTVDGRLPIFFDRMIRRGVEFIVLFGGIVLSVLIGLEAATHWQSWLQFSNYVPFGKTDPVFGNDIGFYVFRLSFLQFAYRALMLALIAAAVAAAAVLYLSRTVDILAGKLKITSVAAGQLGLLLALITALQAIGFRLSAYGLLYTATQTLYGVGYADAHVRLTAIDLATVLAGLGAVVVLFGARRRSIQIVVAGVFLAPVANIIIGGAVAALTQRLVVNPDEFNKERPYLKRHITATQQAYGLDKVDRRPFSFSGTLTAGDLKRNKVTLQSVRLWDYVPLQAAYKQLQEIQQYYNFNEVDIDRYTVDGVYRQVMLSARELDKGALPQTARTWVNLKLKYTHGYGLAMSPVNEVSPEGLPTFFIKDIPPQSSKDAFDVTRPQLYYGESTDDYVIVDTRIGEFDYPRGSTGVETRYAS
ncbi:MAG: UPF0182 family protein, partial [Armatimonadetes bacterium]|nr:UPF0182 family protein [Armatimonadota bacterium]